MSEEPHETSDRPEDQPGYGVDRTQIRELLKLTPDERLKLTVAAAQNMAEFLSKIRFVK